jgi:hypothetical protein
VAWQGHVRPAVRIEQPGTYVTDFRKNLLWIFTRISPGIPILLKPDRNNDQFTRKPTYSYSTSFTVATSAVMVTMVTLLVKIAVVARTHQKRLPQRAFYNVLSLPVFT